MPVHSTASYTSKATILEPTISYSANSYGLTGDVPLLRSFRLEYDILYDFILVQNPHTGMRGLCADRNFDDVYICQDLKPFLQNGSY